MTNTRNLFTYLALFVVLLLSVNVVVVEGLRQKRGVVAVRDGATVTSLRRLTEQLSIGDDPNEDIRTNRLLNMEGI